MQFFKNIILILSSSFLLSNIPDYRVVAEWEEAIGTMIRWPLGIPSELVVELASDDILYVLVESIQQQNIVTNNFQNWDVNLSNVVFIYTYTYSHWTRDHGPQFIIGEDYWKVVNQQFNGYPLENGCDFIAEECDDEMILIDCVGTVFCNNQPQYSEEGYDCYVNNDLCEDFNGDGEILDWLGDGYCDDGNWGLDFMCDEYSWDCGDCGGTITDDNGYCENIIFGNRQVDDDRPLPEQSRGWEEDDDTNVDFANQLGWDIFNLPLYWTGGNFMTDGYEMGFSTQLMVNENNISNEVFKEIISEELYFDDYHILDNPNEESIQHIDCLAKLVNPETIIIKQVSESSPEYDCIEDFADSFYQLNTFYDRPFKIHRILCPAIVAGPWETNPVAAYTNSLILNNKVLIPQYGIVQDELALQTYRDAMPGYEVIGFDGSNSDPWYSEDALHCRTMGIFDPNMIHISHKSIRTEEINANQTTISADIIDYGNVEIDFVEVHWKYSAEDGPYSVFNLDFESADRYSGTFPILNFQSEIEYFIKVTNIEGKTISHPIAGWHNFMINSIAGDVNGDTLLNIQDVILIVNLVLSNQFDPSADLNADNQINIQDIVLLVNIILN